MSRISPIETSRTYISWKRKGVSKLWISHSTRGNRDMERTNGDTLLGNKINPVPLIGPYPALQNKTSHYSHGISLYSEVGHLSCIVEVCVNFKRDTYPGLGVTGVALIIVFTTRPSFKHVRIDIRTLVPPIDRTTTAPLAPSQSDLPPPPGQMYPNTSTPHATTPYDDYTPTSNSSSLSSLNDSSILTTTVVPSNTTDVYTYSDTATLSDFLNYTEDGNSTIVTSLVTSFVSNETLGDNASHVGIPGDVIRHPNKGGLSRSYIVLITSLSIVIGCFAFTALLLRIGSRVMKARKEAEERRRKRRHALRRNQGKRSPQITIKQIRVRIEPDKKGKRAPKGVTKQIRAQPNRLSLRQRQEREAETSFITLPQTSTRTNSALLEIGTCTTDVVLGKGMVSTLKGDSFTSETELLESLDQQKIKHRDNEYDNPIMNLKDPDEDIDMIKNARRTSTETDTLFTSDTSNVPSWNNSPLHFISGRVLRRASSPERTSLSGANAERDSVFRESSESGSNGEVHRRIKLLRMHGRRNSGNNSKDSGYAGGSFASNDSSRNLLAYKDLREDQQKREKPNLGVMKDVDNTRDTTPVIFEMESETAPLVRLNSTRPLNPQQPRRYSLQVPPQPSLYHANVMRNNSHPYYHQVRPVRRIVGSSVRGRRNPLPFYPRDIPRHERYNEYPYIVDCPPLYYEDSYFNFNEPSEHPASTPRRTNNPLYRLPPQENQQYSPNLFPSLSSFPVTPQLHQVPHDQMQSVKRRTTSTQTPTDYSPDTPPASPPSAPSIIRWHREGRSFVIMPREDMALDYLGPIYLAESMSDSDQSLDEPTGIAIASESDTTRPPQQPREGRATNSETDSNQSDRSDSNDDEDSTKTSSKDEDSIKDEKALLLEAKSDWIHDTQL